MNKYIVLIITLFFGYFSFAQTLEIPVVFHIVSHPSKDITQIKEVDFEEIIDSINRRINQVKIDSILLDFRDDIGYPNFTFKLAKKNESCKPIEAVTFHSIKHPKTGLNNYDLKILKKKGYYNKEKYLNIWFVNVSDNENENAGKYSSTLDGIIIDIDELSFIGIKEKDPFLLIHEIGHYLGLKHIWGKDIINNFPFYDGCDFDDGIDDTPSQEKPHIRKQYTIVQDSCGGIGKTNHQNFMDYSYDTGMFTKEQVQVMRDNIITKRPGLLWSSNCEDSSELIIGQFKDQRDNKTYKWVQIGQQNWMTQYLNYTSPNSKCYNNNSSNCTNYGRLYSWGDALNACPDGWRLPSKKDWDELLSVIGNNQSQIRSKYGWNNNKNGTNSTGLNIYPSGMGANVGITIKYQGLGTRADLWLSDSDVFGYSREIGGIYGYNTIPKAGSNPKKDMLSCRCVSDVQGNNNISEIKIGYLKLSLGGWRYTIIFKSKDSVFTKTANGFDTISLPVGKYSVEISHFESTKNEDKIRMGRRQSNTSKMKKVIDKIVPSFYVEENKTFTIYNKVEPHNNSAKKKEGNTLKRLLNTQNNKSQYPKN
ncbi:MAG: hypothetical protein GY756_25690 [bacterium]|nr:hypothetical protein [bacterium]